jgi:hypothetical protein
VTGPKRASAVTAQLHLCDSAPRTPRAWRFTALAGAHTPCQPLQSRDPVLHCRVGGKQVVHGDAGAKHQDGCSPRRLSLARQSYARVFSNSEKRARPRPMQGRVISQAVRGGAVTGRMWSASILARGFLNVGRLRLAASRSHLGRTHRKPWRSPTSMAARSKKNSPA